MVHSVRKIWTFHESTLWEAAGGEAEEREHIKAIRKKHPERSIQREAARIKKNKQKKKQTDEWIGRQSESLADG